MAKQHFNNGQFVLSIGILDDWIDNKQIGTMLELKVHNLMELDKMEDALRTVEVLNIVGECYHYKMLHLHVLSMMDRYSEAYEILQDLDQKYGMNIGLNKLFLRLKTESCVPY